MSCLAAVSHDPGTAATFSTASLIAMTAMDTTNLRLTFTAPANGRVMARLSGCVHGATTFPQILLGILSGSTIVARGSPLGGLKTTAVATAMLTQEVTFAISGLTPGASYTWDAAYGVEITVASTAIKCGGPNNATANNAFGAFCFEVWEAPTLLGSIIYDPSTAVSVATTSGAAMAALDTTNLRQTFTVPASGRVLVRLVGQTHGATTFPTILFGVMNGSTVVMRKAPIGALKGTALATARVTHEACFVVSGLTPAASLTWDAAMGVETAVASTGMKYGGPDNTTTDDAWGAFIFEIWEA